MLERGSLGSVGAPLVGEHFRELVRRHNVVIEEIVSSARPEAHEYDQGHDEWVVVLDGEAALDIDGDAVTLASGEWVLIPAGTPHRVERTAAGTRWLAVHIHQSVEPLRRRAAEDGGTCGRVGSVGDDVVDRAPQ